MPSDKPWEFDPIPGITSTTELYTARRDAAADPAEYRMTMGQVVAFVQATSSPREYTHTQNTAAATWNITHNLGYRPSVNITDTVGNLIEAEVVYTGLNQVTINFSQAIAGKAYLS